MPKSRYQRPSAARRQGMSLLELLACVSIISVLVVAIVPRLGTGSSAAKNESCHVQKEVIEIQAALWKRTKGAWPNSSLSDVGADDRYFPEGLPACPVDGKPYTIDSDGVVIGHTH